MAAMSVLSFPLFIPTTVIQGEGGKETMKGGKIGGNCPVLTWLAITSFQTTYVIFKLFISTYIIETALFLAQYESTRCLLSDAVHETQSFKSVKFSLREVKFAFALRLLPHWTPAKS